MCGYHAAIQLLSVYYHLSMANKCGWHAESTQLFNDLQCESEMK
jgi:hypothetical protein